MKFQKSVGRSSLGLIFNVELHGDIHFSSILRHYAIMKQTPRVTWAPPLRVSPLSCPMTRRWRKRARVAHEHCCGGRRMNTAVRVRAPRSERSRLGSSMLHGVMGCGVRATVRQLRVEVSHLSTKPRPLPYGPPSPRPPLARYLKIWWAK